MNLLNDLLMIKNLLKEQLNFEKFFGKTNLKPKYSLFPGSFAKKVLQRNALFGSSRLQMFFKVGVLKNIRNICSKTPAVSF